MRALSFFAGLAFGAVAPPNKLAAPTKDAEVETDVDIELTGGSGLTPDTDSMALVTDDCSKADNGIKPEKLTGSATDIKATVKFSDMGTYKVCYKLTGKSEYTTVEDASIVVGDQACSHMACSNGFKDADDKDTMKCKGKCDGEDHVKCCQALNPSPCNEMTCPDGHALIDDAKSKKCKTQPCQKDLQQDIDTCCVKQQKCDDVCTGDKVLADGKKGTFCAGEKCTDDEKAKCCDDKADCTADMCGDGQKLLEGKKCAGATCDKDKDKDTCCGAKNACDKAACGDDYVIKSEADLKDKFCKADTCTTTDDQDTCCDKKADCAADLCGDGFKLIDDKKCAGAKCDKDKDKDTCCKAKTSCDKTACGDDYVIKSEADLKDKFCKADKCTTDDDQDTCCDKKADCAADLCGDDFVLNDDKKCAGAKCDKDKDKDTCCSAKADCTAAMCDDKHVLKTDIKKCAKTTCKQDDDQDTCCDKRAKCSTITCPKTMEKNDDNKNKLCKGKECTAKDAAAADAILCCLATCGSFWCGAGKNQEVGMVDKKCEASACGRKKDLNTCCVDAPNPTDAEIGGNVASIDKKDLGDKLTKRLKFAALTDDVTVTSTAQDDEKDMAGSMALDLATKDIEILRDTNWGQNVTNAFRKALADVLKCDDDDITITSLTFPSTNRRLMSFAGFEWPSFGRQLKSGSNANFCVRNCPGKAVANWIPFVAFIAGGTTAAVMALAFFRD
jgi:hypothetical protein